MSAASRIVSTVFLAIDQTVLRIDCFPGEETTHAAGLRLDAISRRAIFLANEHAAICGSPLREKLIEESWH